MIGDWTCQMTVDNYSSRRQQAPRPGANCNRLLQTFLVMRLHFCYMLHSCWFSLREFRFVYSSGSWMLQAMFTTNSQQFAWLVGLGCRLPVCPAWPQPMAMRHGESGADQQPPESRGRSRGRDHCFDGWLTLLVGGGRKLLSSLSNSDGQSLTVTVTNWVCHCRLWQWQWQWHYITVINCAWACAYFSCSGIK